MIVLPSGSASAHPVTRFNPHAHGEASLPVFRTSRNAGQHSNIPSSPLSDSSFPTAQAMGPSVMPENSPNFRFITRESGLLDCVLFAGPDRPLYRIRTETTLGVKTLTTMSSEKESVASIQWRSDPPRVTMRESGVSNVAEWIMATFMSQRGRKTRLVIFSGIKCRGSDISNTATGLTSNWSFVAFPSYGKPTKRVST